MKTIYKRIYLIFQLSILFFKLQLFIYYQNTLEPCRETVFSITDSTDSKQFVTDMLGYCLFETDIENFTVVL